LYSTLLGDPNGAQTFSSEAFGVTVDPNGNFYVVGITGSSNLPTTPGAFQPAIGTTTVIPVTGFAAKFGPVSAGGASLTYLTYLGGLVSFFVDVPSAVAADSQGNAFIGGFTGSADFPVTAGSYQNTCTAFECAFVTKLNSTGTALVWSTFLAASDYFSAIQLDALGNVYATGHNNGNFPATNAVQPSLSSGGGCGAVQGQHIYGQYPVVGAGRLIPAISVDEYAGTLARWFGLSDGQIRQILPNLGNFGSNPYLGFMS
jgi:hypothetical protein